MGTRIDYILTSTSLSPHIIDAFSENASTITDSDHKIVTTIINIEPLEKTKLANYKNNT